MSDTAKDVLRQVNAGAGEINQVARDIVASSLDKYTEALVQYVQRASPTEQERLREVAGRYRLHLIRRSEPPTSSS